MFPKSASIPSILANTVFRATGGARFTLGCIFAYSFLRMPRKRVLLVTLIFALTGLSFIVVLFAFGSTVHRNYQKISAGMSSNEVVAVLGPPTEADGIHC